MGYDLPADSGACLTNHHQRTVCLAGDGSIMMNLQELQTLVHDQVPVKLFVLNNGGYNSIEQTQQNFFQGRLPARSKAASPCLTEPWSARLWKIWPRF